MPKISISLSIYWVYSREISMSKRRYPHNCHSRGCRNYRNPLSPSGRNSLDISWSRRRNNTTHRESQFKNNPGPSHEHRFFARFGFLSPVEIKRWLEDKATIPTMHIIVHLSAPEVFHRLRQIADSHSLSFKSVINEGIRSLGERHDMNKIYGVFNGSAFITHIQACIWTWSIQIPRIYGPSFIFSKKYRIKLRIDGGSFQGS